MGEVVDADGGENDVDIKNEAEEAVIAKIYWGGLHCI